MEILTFMKKMAIFTGQKLCVLLLICLIYLSHCGMILQRGDDEMNYMFIKVIFEGAERSKSNCLNRYGNNVGLHNILDVYKYIKSTCNLIFNLSSPKTLSGLLIIIGLCGDVELNPGPDVCLRCEKSGKRNQVFLACSICDNKVHKVCAGLNYRTLANILKGKNTFTCWRCSVPQFNDSYFEDGHEEDMLNRSRQYNKSCDRNNFSLLSFNSRSMKCYKRKADIAALIESHNPSVLCISETWLNPGISDYEILPSGFEVFRKDRDGRSGGGVLIAAVPELNPIRRFDLETSAEIVWVELKIGTLLLLVGSAYRTTDPGKDLNNDLLSSLSKVQEVQHGFGAVLLCGDFNLQIIWNSDSMPITPLNSISNQFLSAFYDLFLTQLVYEETRVTNSSASILDLILCSDTSIIKSVSVLPEISDHRVVKVFLNIHLPRFKRLSKIMLNYAKANWDLLGELLLNNLPIFYLSFDDIDDAWNKWTRTFWECVQISIPTAVINRRKRPPWISRGIIREIKKRDMLFFRYRKHPTADNKEKYRIKRNFVKKEIRKAHSEYIWSLGMGSDSKAMWKYIHSKSGSTAPSSFISNGKKLTNKSDIAFAFGDLFKNNMVPPADEIDLCSLRCADPVFPIKLVFVSPEYVAQSLKKLKTSSATGPDGIPAKILCICADAIAPSLSSFFNLSISQGSLPYIWKEANVVPIFKNGKKDDLSNYRPISLTSVVCKVLERIIYQEIWSHLQFNNLINDQQHGFLPQRSCSTLLTKLIDDWNLSLDHQAGISIEVVSLDWKKAFDRVPHQCLLQKLEIYGIQGQLLAWLTSFLIGRSQRVMYGGEFSNKVAVTSGVAQGSVLGPLFFIIYMMDLPKCVVSKMMQYADDCLLYRCINDRDDLTILQNDLNTVELWCKANFMEINGDKSKHLTVTRSRKMGISQFVYQGCIISNVKCIKYLGVFISSDLKWNVHTDYVRSKAARLLGFISRNLRDCKSKIKRIAYLSLVHPIIMYGSPAWHPTTKGNMEKLEALHKRIVKFINNGSSVTVINSFPTYFSVVDLMFLKKCFAENIDIDPLYYFKLGYRSVVRGQGVTLYSSFARTSTYQLSYFPRVSSLWNALPPDLKCPMPLHQFRVLILKYFNNL